MTTEKARQSLRRVTYLVAALALLVTAIRLLNSRVPSPALGVTDGRLTPCPGTPNCVSSQADNPDQAVEPLRFEGTVQAAKERLKHVIAGMPSARLVREDGGYLRYEFRSRLLGFVDDVEFWCDEKRQVVEVRSGSRVGRSDLGVNRRRVEVIRRAAGFNSKGL